MFHILETGPHKGALVRRQGTRHLHCIATGKGTVLVLRVAILGGCVTQPGVALPALCLVEYYKRRESLRCSVSREDSPARTGLVGRGGLQHPQSQGSDAGCCPAS
ncbi:hypothetical protein GWK47_037802 [Chionoecetes opilio]|uniref:Uncharacterized protein n=1 Tax=Chionoecetes opilio TaxID=41210 RepID=A0A8J5D197_CHIOP|nr:hypothetical protein GWK47_037802 [Chionoecetes opilio]